MQSIRNLINKVNKLIRRKKEYTSKHQISKVTFYADIYNEKHEKVYTNINFSDIDLNKINFTIRSIHFDNLRFNNTNNQNDLVLFIKNNSKYLYNLNKIYFTQRIQDSIYIQNFDEMLENLKIAHEMSNYINVSYNFNHLSISQNRNKLYYLADYLKSIN